MNSHELNSEGRKKVEAELLRRGAASVTSHVWGSPIKRHRVKKKIFTISFLTRLFSYTAKAIAEPLPLPRFSNIVVSAYTAPVTHQD